PRSLCIYEEPWPVVKLTWTPAQFLERARIWLRDTARGVLHREDQPLEPILAAEPRRLIIPSDLFSRGINDAPEKLLVTVRYSSSVSELVVAKRIEKTTPQERRHAVGFLATAFQTAPQ